MCVQTRACGLCCMRAAVFQYCAYTGALLCVTVTFVSKQRSCVVRRRANFAPYRLALAEKRSHTCVHNARTHKKCDRLAICAERTRAIVASNEIVVTVRTRSHTQQSAERLRGDCSADWVRVIFDYPTDTQNAHRSARRAQ